MLAKLVSSAKPSRPRSLKLLTSSVMSRIVVAWLAPGAATLRRPGFSMMNRRPSGAQAMLTGSSRPPTIVLSSKPEG